MIMPSFFRFVFMILSTIALIYGGLYVMAVYLEPEPKEIRKPVPGVQVRI